MSETTRREVPLDGTMTMRAQLDACGCPHCLLVEELGRMAARLTELLDAPNTEECSVALHAQALEMLVPAAILRVSADSILAERQRRDEQIVGLPLARTRGPLPTQ